MSKRYLIEQANDKNNSEGIIYNKNLYLLEYDIIDWSKYNVYIETDKRIKQITKINSINIYLIIAFDNKNLNE